MNSAHAFRYCFAVAYIFGNMAYGQNYGTVSLPATLADAGAQVQKAASSTPKLNQWCEGPAVAQNGTLFFSEQNAGNIWKVSPSGTMTKLLNIGTYSNGMDFNPLTRHLVVCEKTQITERDTGSGAVLKVITQDGANAWTGGGSGGSNDLSFAINGDLFFTSWNQHIYFHSHDSSVNKDWNFPGSYGTCEWNGIEYIEEKGFVYVCQFGKNRVVTFKVNPTTHLIDTGTLKQFGPTIYAPDGITVDSNYNVYVCNNSGQGSYPNSVVVLDSSGSVLGSIKMTQSSASAAVNCVFGTSMFGGAPNPHTLYIVGDSGAFKVSLKVAGRVWPKTSTVRPGRNEYAQWPTALSFAHGMIAVSGLQGKCGLVLSIFSVDGKLVTTCRTERNAIDLREVVRTQGTYFVQAQSGEQRITAKFVRME